MNILLFFFKIRQKYPCVLIWSTIWICIVQYLSIQFNIFHEYKCKVVLQLALTVFLKLAMHWSNLVRCVCQSRLNKSQSFNWLLSKSEVQEIPLDQWVISVCWQKQEPLSEYNIQVGGGFFYPPHLSGWKNVFFPFSCLLCIATFRAHLHTYYVDRQSR